MNLELGNDIYSLKNTLDIPEGKYYRISGEGNLSYIPSVKNKSGYGFSIKDYMGTTFYITIEEAEKYFISSDAIYNMYRRNEIIDEIISEY